jgi:hypothetical protein
MGCFDRVWARCPRCGGQVEFQTKGGPCESRDYDVYGLTRVKEGVDVLSGISQFAVCEKCDAKVEIVSHVHIDCVRMYEEPKKEKEDQ